MISEKPIFREEEYGVAGGGGGQKFKWLYHDGMTFDFYGVEQAQA